MYSHTKITFFDIPTDLPQRKSVSAYTWRIRAILNYKQLNYTTEWVEGYKVQDACIARGIKPTGTLPNGSPHYTFPAIIDATTSESDPVILSNSHDIALYLDKTYPDPSRPLFPQGIKDVNYTAMSSTMDQAVVLPYVNRLMIDGVSKVVNETYLQGMRNQIKSRIGLDLELLNPQGKEREEIWVKVKDGLHAATKIGTEGAAVTSHEAWTIGGDKPTYGDFMILASLMCLRLSIPEEAMEVAGKWDDGKWIKVIENAEAAGFLEIK